MVSTGLLIVIAMAVAAAVVLGLVLMPAKNKALRNLVYSSAAGAVVGEKKTRRGFARGPVSFVKKFYRDRGLKPPVDGAIQGALFGGPLVGLPFVLLGSGVQILIGILVVLSGPGVLYFLYSRSLTERQKAFSATLPDFLLTLSSAMKSGLSMEQALRELSQGRKTIAEEVFFEISRGLSYGESLDSSLKRFAKMYKSDDTETLRQATAIGKRTGSSLTHVIESVAYSAIERAKVRREIVALTAEGMMSAYVIIALPFVAAAFLLLTNPDYLSVFWETRQGIVLAAVALGLIAVGWVWMRNMIQGESTKL